jgi:hypothetical protein
VKRFSSIAFLIVSNPDLAEALLEYLVETNSTWELLALNLTK